MLATLYDLTIRWASSRRAPFFLALISFTESSFLPIPPDVMLAPMSMANPKLAWRYAAIATIFSVIGGIFGYFLGFFIFDPIIYPLIIKFGYYDAYNTMLHWFNLRGFWAVVLAGFTPIPYKMFTIGAGVLKFSLSGFIVASILGRGIRFFLVSSLMRFSGNKIELFCRNLFSKYGKIIVIIGVGVMFWALCSCSYTDYNLYNSKPNKYHIVRSGETLYSIAKENDIEVERMAKLNHLKFPYIITSGQRLILPTFSYYTYLKEQQNRNKQLSYSNKEPAKNFIANYVGLKNQKKPLEKPKESLATRTAQNRQEDVSDVQSVPFERTPVKRESIQKIKLSSSSATLAHKDWIWPAKGKLINKFGIKGPKANKGVNNKGIDIFGKKGAPIKATANGTVVYSGSNLPGYGNVIIIKHNQDFLSVYAQNEEILVTEQQEVKQGQQIATMGDGDTKKSLLHFEIRYKGKPVDPIKILAQKEN